MGLQTGVAICLSGAELTRTGVSHRCWQFWDWCFTNLRRPWTFGIMIGNCQVDAEAGWHPLVDCTTHHERTWAGYWNWSLEQDAWRTIERSRRVHCRASRVGQLVAPWQVYSLIIVDLGEVGLTRMNTRSPSPVNKGVACRSRIFQG